MIRFDELVNAQAVRVWYPDIDVSAEDIKAFRKKEDLTQTALANILHVSAKDVAKWELGKKKVTGAISVLFYLLIQRPELKDELRKVVVMPSVEIK